MIGGTGRDQLEGGLGGDLFLFASPFDSAIGAFRDLILDFEQGLDKIDLSAAGGTRFIGSKAFTGGAGQIRYAAFDGGTIIEVDNNGDRRADFQVELADGMLLSASDFAALSKSAFQGDYIY